jgi:hypothetical protein
MTDTTTTGDILVQDALGRVRTPLEKREQIRGELGDGGPGPGAEDDKGHSFS